MTTIEWARNPDGTQGKSWNPVVGCSLASPGCTNCYAMKMAARLEAMATANRPKWTKAHRNGQMLAHYIGLTTRTKAGPVYNGKVAMAPDRILTEPLRRREPTTWFVNSMGDLFHENVPDSWIDRVFAVMARCPQHTFIVLTKRSARMREWATHVKALDAALVRDEPRASTNAMAFIPKLAMALSDRAARNGAAAAQFPLPNVWLGVSTEDQRRADERIPDLLNTPAAVRFVSAEPLLGPIDFTRLELLPDKPATSAKGKRYMRAGVHLDALHGRFCESGVEYVGDWDVNLPGPPPDAMQRKLDWIIVGGESGPGARPMHPDWARSIRDQCAASGVPFFFKQYGHWCPDEKLEHPHISRVMFPDAPPLAPLGKHRAGRLLDGRTYDAMPAQRQTESV